MQIEGKRIGVALTGSFCTFEKLYPQIKQMRQAGAELTPIFSDSVQTVSCRFGQPEEYYHKLTKLCGREPVLTIEDAEPLGPAGAFDLLLVAPCSGNTLAKLSNAITDSPVLMAVKGQLRGKRPVVLFLSSNDALGLNAKNIGLLLNAKNIYFVPFGQDSFEKKPNSLVSHAALILPTVEAALDGIQLQPVLQSPHTP